MDKGKDESGVEGGRREEGLVEEEGKGSGPVRKRKRESGGRGKGRERLV